MFDRTRQEAEDGIRKLERLLTEIQELPRSQASSPDELLQQLEVAMARNRGRQSLLGKIERFAWLLSAPLWDFRLHRQIRIIREIATVSGWNSPQIADAIHCLDDLVFARTYGRLAPAPVKHIVRKIAKTGGLATHELRNLVVNRCFRVNDTGRVVVPSERWLFALGLFQFIFATAVVVPFMVLVLLSGANAWYQIVGLTTFAVPYWLACWSFNRHFFSPFRLIPRAQRLIPKLQVAGY